MSPRTYINVCPYWLVSREDVLEARSALVWFNKSQLTVKYPHVTTELIAAVEETSAGDNLGESEIIKAERSKK